MIDQQKSKMRRMFIKILLVILLLSSPVFANDISGKIIGFSCSTCHGRSDLLVKSDVPRLKGQNAKKMEQALLDFKYDRKLSLIMDRISKGFSDSELKKVAWYFSQLKDGD